MKKNLEKDFAKKVLDIMVRDFTQIPPPPKSQVRRRLIALKASTQETTLKEIIAKIENTNTSVEVGSFKAGHDVLKKQILHYLTSLNNN